MSEDMKVDIGLNITTTGEDLLDRLTRKIKVIEAGLRRISETSRNVAKAAGSSLGSVSAGSTRTADRGRQAQDAMRDLRQRFTFESRMASQRVREQRAETREFVARMREQRRSETDSLRAARVQAQEQARSYQQSMGFNTAMLRQRSREESALDRDRQRAARETIRLDNFRFNLRDREERRLHREAVSRDRERARLHSSAMDNARSAASHGRDSYRTLTRTGAAAAAVGAGASAALARRALTAEADIDSAEINARIYGGLSKDAARQLRDQWAAPLAEQLGVPTAKLLTSYTDALKVGIPAEGAKQFSALATQTSEAWSVPFQGVVDTLGTVNSILTSTGEAFSFDRLKSVANSLQYLAAKQSTTPEKLISFLQRGAGASQVLGMSQEAGLAFGSASTSLGNQAGQSGRLFDYIAGRLVKMPDMVKKHGLEGQRAKELVRYLGYGSVGEMDRQRRASPDDFLPDFMERFARVKDTRKQEQLISFFAGQEWLGEFGRMVKGIATYREAANLARESKKLDAIGDVWNLHKLKLAFVFKQISAGFLNIMGEFGKVLSPLARQFGDYFLDWSRKLQGGGLGDRFRAAIEGFVNGLGFRDLQALLNGIFGKPGEGNAGAVETWKATAKAFGEGIRDTVTAIGRLFSLFTGSDGTPEHIARWTGRLLTLAAACVIAAPAVAVLGGLASGITALSLAALAAWRILKAAGVVGGAAASAGAGTAAGAATGAGATGLLGRLLGRFGIGGAAGFASSSSLSKAEQDAIAGRLYGWAQDREKAQGGPASRAWTDPPARKPIENLTDAIRDNTLIQKQNLETNDNLAGLIHKANLNTGQRAQVLKASLSDGASALRNSMLSGSIGGSGGSSGGFGGGPLSGSTPGSALGNPGIGGRGIIGGGNPGGAQASSAPGRGSANHMHGQYGAPGSNLTTITTASGKKVRVHAAAAENFRGFLNELESTGYKINSLGGHAHRSIRGSGRLSQHAFGNAIDINPAQNPMGPRLITDMPKGISDMAAKYGLTWGGDWKRRPDAMHFEWNGRTLADLKRNGATGSGTAGSLTSAIEQAAARAGIDPRIMHGIRAGESGHRADYDLRISSREESYGPYQLNRKGGLGAIFERETGLSLKDPKSIGAQTEWVAQHIRRKLSVNPNYNPASEWYGFKGKRDSDPRWGESGYVPNGVGGGAPLGRSAPLGQNVPLAPERTAPAGGHAGGQQVNAPITIHGAGQDPEALANAVQRRLNDAMNRRTHDLDPSSISNIG